MDIDKKLFPDSGKLRNDGTFTLIDEELDPIECELHADGCVHINTEEYTYIALSTNNLIQIIDFIKKYESKIYKK